MNSILQILSSTPLMTLYILNKEEPVYGFKSMYEQLEHNYGDNKEQTISWSLMQIIETMWMKNCLIQPIQFFKKIQKKSSEFQSRQQCDAHEFFILLLDSIINETKQNSLIPVQSSRNAIQKKYYETLQNYFRENNSFITRIYLTTFINRIRCHHCGYTNHVFDHQMSLSIDINQSRYVNECLDSFFKETLLNEDYKCDKCKQKNVSTQKYSLYQVPNVLCIHLKRFCQVKQRLIKVSSMIDFEFDLDLSNYTSNNVQYELFGVVYHMGQLNNGHYISCTKHPVSQKWYLYDDESPRLIAENQIVNPNAYILFYKKK
jgi:ubiquitin C-terminal hydrolase